MADFPSQLDLFRIVRDTILSKNGAITRDAVERDGADANIIANGIAAAGDEIIGQLINFCAAIFLDSASGTALERLVFDRFGLLKKSAAPAQGTVSFSTAIANPAAFNIPVGTLLQTGDGIQFTTTGQVTFPTGSIGPVLVSVRSTLAGLSQQAAVGTITSIISQITGSPTDLVVTNTIATAGADDEELDASLRDRARRFFVTARRGTLKAIEAGALAVPGVRSATALEVLDSSGRPGRLVFLTVADAFTNVLAQLSSVPATYMTQSQMLAQIVFAGLDDVRAAGIYVQVQVAQLILQPIILGLSFVAGASVDLVTALARAAIVNFINGQPPGTTLNPTALITVLGTVQGLVITGAEIISPLGNVVARPLQAIRTSLALVQATLAPGNTPLLTTTNPDAYTQV